MDNKVFKRNIQPFNGEKYNVWKFWLCTLLAELEVLSVIDEPVPTALTPEWSKKDLIAKSAIVEYLLLSEPFLGFAEENDKARDILTKLDAIYNRRSLATQ